MKWAICLLLILTIGCGIPPAAAAAAAALEQPAMEPPLTDLRQWNSGKDGTAALNGPWELYWERLLEPNDFAGSSPGHALSVSVPAQWKSYELDGQALPNEGFATYRTIVRLSPEASGRPLGLYVNNIASAYRLWINGEPMEGIGTVGADAASMVPRNYPKVHFFAPRAGDNEIVFQVSNFVQRTGGIWEDLELGDAEELAEQHKSQVIIWSFVVGCLLVMTVFSVMLYVSRKQEQAALWFGLICLAICVRSSLLGASYAYVLFPGLSWEWGVKLEYLSEIVTILSLTAFVNKQYPGDAVSRILPVFAVSLATFGAFVLATPAKVYTQFMVPYVIVLLFPVFLYVLFVYIRATVRRRTGSRANVVGFIIFFAAVVHEILYYTGYVPFGGLVSFGLLLFLLTQLLNLSLLFTRAVTRSERLSVELDNVIASQEETIRQRTSSLQELNEKLEQGNRELSRIEHVRSTLLAEVHHDLSTPITAIKGFAKAIKSGVIPGDEAPQFAGRIYERSHILEKLIDNVIELSQLSTGELKLQLLEEPIIPVLRQLCQQYAAEANTRGIALIWEEPQFPLPPGEEPLVALDRFRFERVFANLISNAVKYTPGEGVIRVWAEYAETDRAERGHLVIHVTDSGIGMAESELSHIFERRYRIPGTQHAQAGSGLGLAICREIIACHHGEIEAFSKPGKGSDFRITLPAIVREEPAEQKRLAEGR